MARRVLYADRDKRTTLRINIAREWATTDFVDLFSEFEMLNKMACLGEVLESHGGDLPVALRWYHTPYLPLWRDNSFEEFEIKEQLEDVHLRLFMLKIMPTPPPLQVNRIEYGSPGFTDLAGIGRIVSEIRKFVFGISDRLIATEDRALAREERSQKILALKINNAEKLLKLSAKVRMDPEARAALVRRVLLSDTAIETKLLEGKVTSFDGPDQ